MTDRATDRRLVLKRLGQAGAVLGASGALAALGLSGPGRFRGRAPARGLRDLRVADEPARPPARRRARKRPRLDWCARPSTALGGMERFVKRGETVLVKPNMAWDRTPEQGANTNPEVVAEVVRLCRAAGARRVIVAENPVHDAERVAARSGIRAAVAAAGGELVLPGASGFEWTTLGGSVLASWDVLSVALPGRPPGQRARGQAPLALPPDLRAQEPHGPHRGQPGAAAPGHPPGARGPGGGLPPDPDGRGRHARDDAQRADRAAGSRTWRR